MNPDLKEIAKLFLKLRLIGFGAPAHNCNDADKNRHKKKMVFRTGIFKLI
jgi:hypothetical protein